MKIKLGDYFIETDERQFKVKKYIGKDKDGEKDLYKTYAYCTTLTGALKFIPQQVIRDNEDINVIKDKLTQIEQEMKILEELKKLVDENYDSEDCGLTEEYSSGNENDIFNDGERFGASWLAYRVGEIIGMELEEPKEQKYSWE